MGANNADFQGGQGFHITDEPDSDGVDKSSRILRLHSAQHGQNAASLDYHSDPIGVTYIDYLRSPYEGSGHATALLEHLYHKFPSHNIDWGEILHPAASHLYNKFSNKYGRSYSWEDWEDDY
jgi:hypothetical protein